jgi:hypothetical protein
MPAVCRLVCSPKVIDELNINYANLRYSVNCTERGLALVRLGYMNKL